MDFWKGRWRGQAHCSCGSVVKVTVTTIRTALNLHHMQISILFLLLNYAILPKMKPCEGYSRLCEVICSIMKTVLWGHCYEYSTVKTAIWRTHLKAFLWKQYFEDSVTKTSSWRHCYKDSTVKTALWRQYFEDTVKIVLRRQYFEDTYENSAMKTALWRQFYEDIIIKTVLRRQRCEDIFMKTIWKTLLK